MRTAVYLVIAFYILVSAWYIFIEVKNKDFIEGLPPSQKSVSPNSGIENRDLSEREVLTDETPIVKSVAPSEDINSASVVPSDDFDSETEETPSAQIDEPDPFHIENNMTQDNSKRSPKDTPGAVFETPPDLTQVSIEELRERNRKHLIEKHGDIPEIDIFLKHFPFSAIQQGETKITIENTVTLEEDLEYKRALAVLFPSEENQKSYEDALHIAEQSKH